MAKKKVKVSSTDIVKMAAGLIPGNDIAVLLLAPDLYKHCRQVMSNDKSAKRLIIRGVHVMGDDRLSPGDVKFVFRDNFKELFSVPGLDKMIADMNALMKERDKTELFG